MACVHLSTTSLPHSSSRTEIRVPFELIELVEKLKNICSIKKFDRKDGVYVAGPSRDVHVASDKEGRKIIFIKAGQGPRKITARMEQIAFMISHRLNLDVVSPTMAIEGYKALVDQNVSHDYRKYFLSSAGNYEGVVVQEGISLNPHQFHLGKELGKDNMDAALNTDQLCNAIFYNIITGRMDADRTNSCIDNLNRVVEIDNEGIGCEETNSWMLGCFPNFVLPKKATENLLAKDISIINGVFDDVSHFGITKLWNQRTKEFDIEYDCQKIITTNFAKLKNFLADNKEKDIRVRDLNLMLNSFI